MPAAKYKFMLVWCEAALKRLPISHSNHSTEDMSQPSGVFCVCGHIVLVQWLAALPLAANTSTMVAVSVHCTHLRLVVSCQGMERKASRPSDRVVLVTSSPPHQQRSCMASAQSYGFLCTHQRGMLRSAACQGQPSRHAEAETATTCLRLISCTFTLMRASFVLGVVHKAERVMQAKNGIATLG